MRLIDDHAAHRQRESKLDRALFVAGVQPDRVTRALMAQQPLRERRCGSKVGGAVERQHGRELLAGKRMRRADARLGDDQEARIQQRRARKPGAQGDRGRVLGDKGRSGSPGGEHRALELARFAFVEQNAAGRRERGEQGLRDRRHRDHTVLRRAAGRVIEGLGARDLVGGIREIGRLVDDHRDVAGPHTDRGRAARVGCANIGLRARGDDQVDLAHQLRGDFARHRRRHLLHEIERRTDTVQLGVDVAKQQRQRRCPLGRRRDDDGISSLERIDDVIGRCGGRIGRWRDRADDTDRAGDFH